MRKGRKYFRSGSLKDSCFPPRSRLPFLVMELDGQLAEDPAALALCCPLLAPFRCGARMWNPAL